MKKFVLLMLILVGVSLISSAESTYMHIMRGDGTWTVFDLNQVDRMKFADGNVLILDAQGGQVAAMPLAEFSMMRFLNTPSGIDTTTLTEAGDEIAVNGSTLTLRADGTLRIFDIQGRALVEIPSLSGTSTVDISALPAGNYIIAIGNYTKKIRK